MLWPLKIIKKRLYVITHNVGLRNNLYVQQYKQYISDTTTLQQNFVNMLHSTLVN